MKIIIDITGIELTPGNNGKDCQGNGEHYDQSGNLIECCCDECSYLLCCNDENFELSCVQCHSYDCPRCKNKSRHDDEFPF